MAEPSLSARRLVKTFGSGETENRVLRDITLDVMPGQLSLLMGPSGCGKTTLLSVLSGLLPPTGGQVLADGSELYALSEADRREFRRRHVGFIFQHFHLFPTLTVSEQLEMVLQWGDGLPAGEAARRTKELLGVLNLAQKADLLPLQLSGGEQQRVAIARALIKNPDLVFADEPTSALDWEHGKQVMEILTVAAHKRCCTVLAVTHDPRLIPFADRIINMEDGALKAGETQATVLTSRPESGQDLVRT